jgi:two-component system sensor histidine kinase QseC
VPGRGKSSTELVLRRGQQGLASRTGQVLERNLARLQQLVDRSLYSARLAAGAPAPRARVELQKLVVEVVQALSPEAAARIHVEVPEELAFEVNRLAIASLLRNLIDNALRYSPAPAPVTVRARREGESIRLEVEDRCGGISREVEEQLEQAEPGGKALGLALVREAVQEHGGQVTVHNQPGVGCVFSVLVPMGG